MWHDALYVNRIGSYAIGMMVEAYDYYANHSNAFVRLIGAVVGWAILGLPCAIVGAWAGVIGGVVLDGVCGVLVDVFFRDEFFNAAKKAKRIGGCLWMTIHTAKIYSGFPVMWATFGANNGGKCFGS
jgi:hypothetical protein